MPSETPDLASLLAETMDATQGRIHTALPATVLAFNQALQTITAKPTVSARIRDPDTGALVPVPIPAIGNVPVAYPSAAGFSITWPLTVGDPVLLVFAERSLDEYLTTGLTETVPVDTRRHALDDAIAIPQGPRPDPQALPATAYTPTGMVLRGADIRLGSSAATDFVALASLVLARLQAIKTAFDTHVHTGVTTGPGSSGTPAAPMPAPSSVAATKVKAE